MEPTGVAVFYIRIVLLGLLYTLPPVEEVFLSFLEFHVPSPAEMLKLERTTISVLLR